MGKGKRRVGERGDRVVVEDPRADEPIEMPGDMMATSGGGLRGMNIYHVRNAAGKVLLSLQVVCPMCTERLRLADEAREIFEWDRQDKKAKRGAR